MGLVPYVEFVQFFCALQVSELPVKVALATFHKICVFVHFYFVLVHFLEVLGVSIVSHWVVTEKISHVDIHRLVFFWRRLINVIAIGSIALAGLGVRSFEGKLQLFGRRSRECCLGSGRR